MNPRIQLLTAAVVGAAVGAASGYILARKLLEAKYEKMYETEIEAAKTLNSMFHKTEEYSSPVKAAAALGVVGAPKGLDATAAEKLVLGLGYRGEKSLSPDELTRNRNRPYLIRPDEFYDNESGLEQLTLTYFVGDDTLCDEADQIIEDVENAIGKANLDCFGQLSGDDNVLHLRNEKLRVEYEIVKAEGSYSEVVLGPKED